MTLDALIVSAGLTALAEVGDKTQALAIVLAARFARPWAVMAGVAAAALFGLAIPDSWFIWPRLHWVVGAGLVSLAAWTLMPHPSDKREHHATAFAVFALTLVATALLDQGDKSQAAVAAMVARFEATIALVWIGVAAGQLLANAPGVFIGEALAERVSLRIIRPLSAAAIAAIGLWVIGVG